MYEETALELIAFETRLAEVQYYKYQAKFNTWHSNKMHMCLLISVMILLQIFLSDVDLRNIDITYNKMRLGELSDLFPVVSSLIDYSSLLSLSLSATSTCISL